MVIIGHRGLIPIGKIHNIHHVLVVDVHVQHPYFTSIDCRVVVVVARWSAKCGDVQFVGGALCGDGQMVARRCPCGPSDG